MYNLGGSVVRKLPAFVFVGAAAAVLGGSAIAASPAATSSKAASPKTAKTHVMNVPLPDGSVARVEYVGDVAPKVTVAPRTMAAMGDWGPQMMPFPSFAGFDRMIEEMQRQSQEMMRRAQEMARRPAGAPGAAPYIASYGDMPVGQSSTTIVSVSNNGVTCTRATEVVSQGPGKPPKVTTNVSGKCDDGAARPDGPVNRT